MKRKSLIALLMVLGCAGYADFDLYAQAKKAGGGTAQATSIASGVVCDEEGEPLIGATVMEVGTQNGVTTDIEGNFRLNVKPNAMLKISYIGYQPVEVKAAQGLKVVMSATNTMLDEVVAIGYGTARKKDLTGSVFQVKPDDMKNSSVGTVQGYLANVPGLNLGLDNSAKGGGSLQIRGQRSVYTGGGHNDPLLIVDGMQFYGDLSEINPKDIAQIDILKDASSAAVYGARAANGVIIITTKKGKQGKPTVNLTANVGWTQRASYERYFTPEEYIQHKVDFFESSTAGYNEATGKWDYYQNGQVNYGFYRNPSKVSDLQAWRSWSDNEGLSDRRIWGSRLNLHDELLDNFEAGQEYNPLDDVYRTGFRQDYQVSVSGATDKANYYFSAGYLKNEGVRIGDQYESVRMSTRTNMDVTNWFSFGGRVNFQHRSDGNKGDLNPSGLMDYSPYDNVKDADGNWLQYGNISYSQRRENPYFDAQYKDLEKGYTAVQGQFDITIKLPYGFQYQFNVSPRYEFYYDRFFMAQSKPNTDPTGRGVNREQTRRFDWTLNNIITWNKTYGDVHEINVTLVQEAEERRRWRDRIEARNITPTDANGFHSITGYDKTAGGSNMSVSDHHETADGMLARGQYTYDSRYMLTASIRRDGYCAFGRNNPHAVFPAFAGAWTFTNEKFWNQEWLNFGKLRLSWGQNGNRSLSDVFIGLSNLSVGTWANYYYNNNTYNYAYLYVSRPENPNLKWERSEAYNIGLDLNFLNNRINVTADYYYTQTKDMIMSQTLPAFQGFPNFTTNLGRVDNNGIELNINTQNIVLDNFAWNTSFNFSYNNNKIKHLYGEYDPETGKELDDIGSGWFIGHSINEIWDYKCIGIWQSDEWEEAAKYNQQPGDPKVWNNPDNDVYDEQGNLVRAVYNNDDKLFLGQRNYPVLMGMRNEFILFKNLSISFNLTSKIGAKSNRGEYQYDAFLNQDDAGGFLKNGMRNQRWKEYWTIDNPSDKYARINALGPAGAENVKLYQNRSFVRLQDLAIGYTFPESIVKKMYLTGLRVYGNVNNLFVIKSSDWYYGDPENQNYAPRTFSLGLDVTF